MISSCYRGVFVLLTAIALQTPRAAVSQGIVEDCWWTGCQSSAWLVTGCNQYHRTQKNVKTCTGGSEYYCCANVGLQQPVGDCWWTGCQLNEWQVKGCDNYNRTETDREECPDGIKYKCCVGNVAVHLPSTSLPNDKCWWTGCQPNDWMVKGCDSYNRTETAREHCPNGFKYKCCEETTAVHHMKQSSTKEKCWWTDCQPNEGLVKGCESYNSTKTAWEQCPEGIKYKCCMEVHEAIHLPEPNLPKEDCWWTGCQLNEWLVKGCDSYNRTEMAREQCPDGLKYKCCVGTTAVNLPEPSSPKEDCWWTGCQLNEWLVKGCDSYNRTETAQEQCPDGLKYKCCTGISAAIHLPDPSLPKEECWWTGCQPNNWLIKGCDSYNRTEIAREQCLDGFKYKCCVGITAVHLPEPSLPKEDCWWTGCQLNEWLVKGCRNYNRIEKEREQCPDGFKYKCCTGETAVSPILTAVTRLPYLSSEPEEKCWWTGCQLTKWNIRGCPSNTVQTGTHACPRGDLYQCCLPRKKSTVSDSMVNRRKDYRK
ncbi:Hypothetical protein CINCED_3A024261 [Cinara cedri]|uniref:Uncharacterized protein n=1 Tax=Cinara cedri TaxID=506608 RepID=A0A5E4N4E3_9HEMI|nr:Hypothetical protein CINCED_3A024261 [Cinara cedri]